MQQIIFPENIHRRLAFFLAAEEWVARCLPADEYFFTWCVAPTVIIGRNQDIWSEVNLEYCRRKGIDVCRRRSGGGCVYADDRNIMMSHITAHTDVASVFGRYTAMVAAQLRAMGLEAHPSGRNDIIIGDRKISGSAYYLLADRSIVHSTMLFETDIENMLNAITPSRAKLESKQVKSVQARIVTARELMPQMDFAEFHDGLVDGLATGRYRVTDDDMRHIAEIEKTYYSSDWLLYGDSQRGAKGRLRRIEGVGTVALRAVTNSNDEIADIRVDGDCFVIGDMSDLTARVAGCKLDASALAIRLADTDTGAYITNMTNNTFIELLTNP